MTGKKPGTKHENSQKRKGGYSAGAADKSAIDRRSQLEQGARRINRASRQMMRDQRFFWYVLFVPPHKEFIAQKIVSQWIAKTGNGQNGPPAGCVYLPLHARWRRESRFTRKKKRFSYPVIPGCLFFGTRNEVHCWFDLLALHIVSGVMRVADRLVSVSGKDLELFVSRNREEIERQRKHHKGDGARLLASGDQANVIDGPFAGHRVDIKAINGENAKILLKFLGSNQEVDIAIDRLRSGS